MKFTRGVRGPEQRSGRTGAKIGDLPFGQIFVGQAEAPHLTEKVASVYVVGDEIAIFGQPEIQMPPR
ncbi:MAG TPA: hypothetical protein VHJ19_05895 [Gammaproteobacteria bacterium]|nr:hypothetical protein [Gammaproteobacteria bacterium]